MKATGTIGFSDQEFAEGTFEARRAAREEHRQRQRLEIARKAGWPEVQAGDLRRHGPFLEHGKTGQLYLQHLGEIAGPADPVAAFFIAAGTPGTVEFLQHPPSGPLTRKALAERRKRKGAA